MSLYVKEMPKCCYDCSLCHSQPKVTEVYPERFEYNDKDCWVCGATGYFIADVCCDEDDEDGDLLHNQRLSSCPLIQMPKSCITIINAKDKKEQIKKEEYEKKQEEKFKQFEVKLNTVYIHKDCKEIVLPIEVVDKNTDGNLYKSVIYDIEEDYFMFDTYTARKLFECTCRLTTEVQKKLKVQKKPYSKYRHNFIKERLRTYRDLYSKDYVYKEIGNGFGFLYCKE